MCKRSRWCENPAHDGSWSSSSPWLVSWWTRFFPHPPSLKAKRIQKQPRALALPVARPALEFKAIICALPATYLVDLTVAQLRLKVRRFYCTNLECGRTTFAEGFSGLLERKAQRTTRRKGCHAKVGLSLSGEAGTHLLSHLGMLRGCLESSDTLLSQSANHQDNPSGIDPPSADPYQALEIA